MKRITDPWFEFAGVKNTALGVMLLSMPVRPHAARRGEQVQVPGRDGDFWIDGGGYDGILVRVPCFVDDPSNIAAIMKWMTGAGYLRFSDEPTKAYRARVTKEFSRSNKLARFTSQEFIVTFDCHPCQYHYPIPSFSLENGTPINNLGTHYAEPKITMTVTGDVSLTIGAQTLAISEYTGPIALDMEARVAYNGDVNLCPKVSGDWPILVQPGTNAVSWTGTVSAASMIANWRDI